MTAVDRVEPELGRAARFRFGVRARILATVLVLSALGMALTGTAIVISERDQMLSRADGILRRDVADFHKIAESEVTRSADVRGILSAALQRRAPGQDIAILGLIDGRPALVPSGSQSLAWGRETTLLARLAALPPDAPTRIREARTRSGPIRYAAVQLRVAGRPEVGTYVIAVLLRPGWTQVVRDARRFAVFSGASLVLVAAGGWLVAGRLLRRLRLLRAAAERSSHIDLSARIPVTGRDDITDLTITFNDMLDRLDTAFDAQQSFLDDAGHELRTPLTIVRGHLEVVDVSNPADVADTRSLVLDELDRMGRLISDLIVLARAGRPDFVRLAPVRPDHLVFDVVEKAQALGRRRWVVDGTASSSVMADSQRLTQALLQLADNAVRFTGPDDVIAIGASVSRDRVYLWVRDTGPGVAPADAERIFERFGRAAVGRGDEGSGLGLAIVSAIAQAHGGRVVLDRGGPGAKFTLILPHRPADGDHAAESGRRGVVGGAAMTRAVPREARRPDDAPAGVGP